VRTAESTVPITPRVTEPPPLPEQPTAPLTIDYFNARHPLHALKQRAALDARRRMYRRVLQLAQPTAATRIVYADREFDLALSFAVLEHVGSAQNQRQFLAELARVADAFIVYTPYRYFPMEMHTLLPLLHWLPVHWHRAILRRLGMTFWAQEQHLNLLSVASIRRLLPRPGHADIRLLWSVGFPSNLEVHWRRQ
jgi:hypothetical protein